MESFSKKIAWLEWFGLVAMALSLPLSESVKNIAFGLALLCFILKRAIDKKASFRLYPFGAGIAIFFAASVVTTFFAADLHRSLKGLWDIFMIGFSFYIVANDMDGRARRDIVAALVASIAIGSVWGLYKVLFAGKRYLEIISLGHFNHTAIYLATMLSLIGALLLLKRDMEWRLKAALWASAALSFAALVLTTSRGSLVGLSAAGIVFLLTRGNWRHWAACAALVVVILAGANLQESFKDKFASSYSMGVRTAIWKNGLAAFAERPIAGVGLNHFEKIDFDRYGHPEGKAPHAHSLYVNVAAQGGLLGLFGLFAIFYGFVRTWLNFRAAPRGSLEEALAYSAAGAFIIVAVTGIFNTTFHHEHGMLFAILAALMVRNGAPEASGADR